jgi:glycerol-3-phosphate acyltransferase PlsX
VVSSIHIAVDAMGGDVGPAVTVPASLSLLGQTSSLTISLFGKDYLIEPHLAGLDPDIRSRVEVENCQTEVEMHEKPSLALRNKRDSSLFRCVEMVSEGKAHACVSAGNTGALMATGRYLLKTFPGIDRPAICAEIPTLTGGCLLLDLGANVDSHSDHLYQFAVMGSVMAKTLNNNHSPSVGLLNIGEEEIKGNEQVKMANALFEESPDIHYIGYVEGDDVYQGVADVVVCDGFVGNVLLKASEGVARLVMEKMQRSLDRNFLTRLLARISKKFLMSLENEIDPSRYNGASFLGLNGSVVVSHGAADETAFTRALQLACFEAEQDLPAKIHAQLELMGSY